jgi:hypothetical protein
LFFAAALTWRYNPALGKIEDRMISISTADQSHQKQRDQNMFFQRIPVVSAARAERDRLVSGPDGAIIRRINERRVSSNIAASFTVQI